jgi:hypothetical protein
MKLGKTALLEITNIVLMGLLEDKDVSELLRELDVEEKEGVLEITAEYEKNHPRAGDWDVQGEDS